MAAAGRLTPDRLAAEVGDLLPEGPLAVALGGGADSAVAAWAAAQHTTTRGVFVRHGLDGSAPLEQSASALGALLGFDVALVDAPVDPGPSLESRARDARWTGIENAVGAHETVVTGHTQDDQAETVMMNLMRGAGSAGVAGMLRSRPGVVRPLLGFSRAAIRLLAEELGLPFADDPANEDVTFLRNRIRRDLLPDLERDYAPGIRAALARAGTLAAADDRLIESFSDELAVARDAGGAEIPAAALVTAPKPVAARCVRRALRGLLAPYAGSEADIEAVLAVAIGRSESATITGALAVTREGPFVRIDAGRTAGEAPGPIAITVPGEIRFGEHSVAFEDADASQITPTSTLLLDPTVFGRRTVVEAAAEGARIDIDSGTKPVRTVLSERDIPVRNRSTWPVVAEGGRIAAIVGIRVAPWARPTTRQAIAIRWKQESP